MRKVSILRASVVLLLTLMPCLVGCGPREQRYTITKPMMGTLVAITVCDINEDHAFETLNNAFAEMERIEKLMSTRMVDSEVSRINLRAFPKPIPVDLEVYSLIQRSIECCRMTDGAFDITVGPLLKLWPLYKAKKILPTDVQIKTALKLVGCGKIELVPECHCVGFRKQGMRIDLGGIAKGYAIGRAIDVIRKAGIRDALVNAGGDLYALGTRPDGAPWRVGIRHPRIPGELIAVLSVKDLAIMTSGDYERYFIKNGKRYSHIIDPHTGFTARGTASVTIAAHDPTIADAIATGVLVLGARKGLQLIERLPGIEGAILSEGEGKRLKLSVSSGFKDLFHVDEEKLAY